MRSFNIMNMNMIMYNVNSALPSCDSVVFVPCFMPAPLGVSNGIKFNIGT